MSLDVVTTANQMAVLIGGRAPLWTVQSDADPTLPPATVSSGVPLLNTVKSLLWLQLRANVAGRTASIQITTQAGANITVAVDTNNVVYDGSAASSIAEQATQLAAAITADATVGALVTATASGDTVTLVGKAFADYSVDVSFSTTGAATVTADAISATARVYELPRGINAPGWVAPDATISLNQYGRRVRFDSSGLDRGYVQITDLAKAAGDGAGVVARPAVVTWGPAVLENG